MLLITFLRLGEADRGARDRRPGPSDLGLDSTGKSTLNAPDMNIDDAELADNNEIRSYEHS
jgi:hypothetical protein